jgi:hypothetical protein
LKDDAEGIKRMDYAWGREREGERVVRTIFVETDS